MRIKQFTEKYGISGDTARYYEDEVMNPDKVVAFAGLAAQVSQQSYTQIVPGEKHLTILNDTGKLIGPWVLRTGAK